MPFSVLSNLFHVERARQRITRSVMSAGFALPALGEINLNNDEPPLLATNMRVTFLLTRVKDGIGRYGFSPVPIEEEAGLVTELARKLWEFSTVHGWGIRCRGVSEAVESMRLQNLEPRTIVVSEHLARGVLGQETPPEGLAGVVDRMQVIVTNIPETVALVALAPMMAGICVRTGDHVGLLVRPLAFRVVQT
jgi:hypothetical protein